MKIDNKEIIEIMTKNHEDSMQSLMRNMDKFFMSIDDLQMSEIDEVLKEVITKNFKE